MKRSTKRLTAAILSAIITLTAFTAVTVSAATDTQEAVSAKVTAEPVGDGEPEPQPVVGNVTGLKKTTTEQNSINLVWDATEGATGYIVYRSNADTENGVFHRLGAVTKTTFTDTKLTAGTAYHYKVSAYIAKDGVIYEGATKLYRTATQPQRVANLTRARCSTVNMLTWTATPKATGYKILRSSPESGNKEVLYKTLGANATSFSDTNIKQGNIYTYNVVAIRELYGTAVYHAPSNRMTCLAGLCAPNFSTVTNLYYVTLKWSRNPYATRYNVYYSTNKNATAYTKAGSTTGTSFTTGKLPGGKKLYFRVYPIYEKNGRLVTGTAHTKEVTVSNKMYGITVPSTYVEVSISKQHMWLYKDGKCIVSTDVVTGNRYTADTPKGYFDMYSRATDTVLVGDGYASPVDYWMAFCGGCGIHDASWRSEFGGDIYKYNGSHGCVNTPYSAVKKIYNNTAYGTPVIVY